MNLKFTRPRWLLMLLAAVGLLISLSAGAVDYPLEEAIDDAGRQRMLSQRILKAYVQIGLGLQQQQSEQELVEAVSTFESQYQRLHQWQHEPLVAEQLERVGHLWKVYKQRALSKVSAPEAQKLLGLSESVLSESQRLVLILQQLSGTQAAELINVAGRQRMLSQQMAKYYLLASWGIDTPAISNKMARVRTEFAAALLLLEANTYANEELVELLAQIEADWAWFNSAIEQPGERYNLVVLDASDQLLGQLERLASLYVKEGKKASRP